MQIEDSDGRIYSPQSKKEINLIIDRLGKDLDHCILSNGELFIQAAGSDRALIVQYSEGSDMYEASETQTPEVVKELFASFFDKNDSWKTNISFTPVVTGNAHVVNSDDFSGQKKETSFQQNNLKKGILDSIKHEISQNVSGMVRRGIRDLFRKLK